MLHLVFQSLADSSILERFAQGDDAVFLEDAVFALAKNARLAAVLTRLLEHNRFYVLADDIAARGLSAEELVNGIAVIDYAGLVALTVNNVLIQSWS